MFNAVISELVCIFVLIAFHILSLKIKKKACNVDREKTTNLLLYSKFNLNLITG